VMGYALTHDGMLEFSCFYNIEYYLLFFVNFL
jgi:hypothetical protein